MNNFENGKSLIKNFLFLITHSIVEEVSSIANAEAESCNKNLAQKTLNKEKVADPLLDTSPGTSKYCSCCSSRKLQDLICSAAPERTDVPSLRSIESFVCRICHNCENPEKYDNSVAA